MPEPKRPLKVFLCHASADKPKVRELYRYLRRRGIQPWLDAEDLVGGQNWREEIPKAIRASEAIIICLSKNSINKEGFVQAEITFALEKALEIPQGRIFIIPVRFEDCEVPSKLEGYHWVDLFEQDGFPKLMKSLRTRASQLERATVQVPQPNESSPNLTSVSEDKVGSESPDTVGRDKAERQADRKTTLIQSPSKLFNTQKPTSAKTVFPLGTIGIIGIIILVLWAGSWAIPKFIAMMPIAKATTTQRPVVQITPTNSLVVPIKTIRPNATPTKTQTPASTALPTEITDTKGAKMELVSVSGGDLFYMDKYEVTNESYKICVTSGTCSLPTNLTYYNQDLYSNHPVVYVSHDNAKSYCEWRGARLPLTSEWDVAVQGHPWIKQPDCKYANYAYGVTGESNWDFSGQYAKHIFVPTGYLYCFGATVPVGSLELGKSIFGIYDLIGNVAEWSASNTFVQGGSWANYKPIDGQTLITRTTPTTTNTIGFRCAITP